MTVKELICDVLDWIAEASYEIEQAVYRFALRYTKEVIWGWFLFLFCLGFVMGRLS